jgi:hypothetical protein
MKPSWSDAASDAARRLAIITAAGALVGLVVAGVGSRLAMSLLAHLNPDAHGVQSDDDFEIGRFTVSNTLKLLVTTTGLGLVGAAVYALVRGLRTGHRGFDLLALTVGPAVVVGSLIVHTDGVDFTRLDPPLVAIGLFVAVPAAYCLGLVLLAEWWLRPESAWSRSGGWGYLPLALWIPLFPILGVLANLWAAREALQRRVAALQHPAFVWVGRAGLTAAFVLGLVDLGQDAAELT